MGHKADKSFFNEKRHWSKRKDRILECYLPPYLSKIATQGHPILIVDAFAGPGKFGDGELGSPLIICQSIQESLSKGLSVPVAALCIEADKEAFSELNESIEQFPFAEARHGKFGDCIQEIQEKAKDHSVFLYVDPWTVEGLEWDHMDHIFQHLSISKMSIEILMNFNARSFARRGLAALKLAIPELDLKIEDSEEVDAPLAAPPSLEGLNTVVGGDWWQNILERASSFPEKVQDMTDGVCERLRKRFKEVCKHAIKALPHHVVPKYYLIFASRHPDALILMNDEMVKSQQTLAELAKPRSPTLFEMRSTDLVPDIEKLPSIILRHASQPKERGIIILDVIRECFCQFSVKQIRGCIHGMLKERKLKSETGKIRINDTVRIFAVS
ncbi:MAG TPA: three-Cys-motif partner protein TcmP [Sedimentisphaerales bacterium]|nr:three-Cys-motif partner protein TcmP [Sedimentisphaerales bacterium]